MKTKHIMNCKYSGKSYELNLPTEKKLEPFGTVWFHEDDNHSDKLTQEQKNLSKKVTKLLEIEYPEQRSKAWFDMRKNCISASDGGCVVSYNQHEPPYMIYLKKLFELPFEPNGACYHGTKLEQIATMVYEYRMNVKIEEFGLVRHPTISCIGASPDGIIGKYMLNSDKKTKYVGRMLEIKCPKSRQINDKDPFDHIKYYWVQVQLQLECCDLEECDFWQNIIKEYDNRKEFIEDTSPEEPFRSKTTGMEKGCLIQLLPKEKMQNITNEVIWGYSKFLYPPRIDMTPLELDVWIAETVNNMEEYLTQDIYGKNVDIMVGIKMNIMNEEFEKEYLEEIMAKVQSKVDFVLNMGYKISEKKKKEYYVDILEKMRKDYVTNVSKKLLELKFVKYLITKFKSDLTFDYNCENLLEKMLDLDLDEEFGEKIRKVENLKKLCKLMKELQFAEKYTFHRVYYWRMEKTHCELVKRDREWFKLNLPKFETMWKNILFLRENKDKAELLKKYIDSLPTKEVHFEKEIKDNEEVQRFIDILCNPPDNNVDNDNYKKEISKFF